MSRKSIRFPYTFIILFIVLELLALIGTIGLEMDDFDGGYDAG